MKRPHLAILVTVVLAACSPALAPAATPASTPVPSATGGGPAAPPSASTGSPVLLARVEYAGGSVTVDFARARYPIVSVYADGTVITQGTAWLWADPRPLVAPASVQRLTPDAVARVRETITAAHLSSAVFAAAAPGDAPETILRLDGGRVVIRLGPDNPTVPFPPAEAVARRPADDLVAVLTDLTGFTGPGGISDPQPYVPSALLLYLTPSADGTPSGSPLAWTLTVPPSAFGEPLPDGSRCGAVTGADVPALWQQVSGATEFAHVRVGGADWTPVVRPLLPDEAARCPAGG